MFEIISKIFFSLQTFYFLEVVLDLDKYIFSWLMCLVGCIRLGSFCIKVNTVNKIK